ncbi:MAG: alpha/beta hydrolase [Candidatus Helarchaeota archaeon]
MIFIGLYWRTGFLQASSIDNRDLKYWNYTNGLQQNSSEFEINGSKEICWLLIHSYTSTPNEMKELAEKISLEFKDYIYVPRLKGHGETPSKILNLSLNNWYLQIEKEFNRLNKECKKINVVGSSIGGGISLKLAQEKEFNHLYLVNPYLFAPYKIYYIFKPETYIKYLGNILQYSKKRKLAQINSPEEIKTHIAYWNMPYAPIKNSLDFFEQVKINLNKINEPILTQHSINDKTSSIKSSELIFNNVNSSEKEIIKFEKSNHVLLKDYDKQDTINNIINFEKRLR